MTSNQTFRSKTRTSTRAKVFKFGDSVGLTPLAANTSSGCPEKLKLNKSHARMHNHKLVSYFGKLPEST